MFFRRVIPTIGLLTFEGRKERFGDVSSGTVNWAVEQGVTNSTNVTVLALVITCTRGQIVTFLYEAFAE